VQAQVSLEPVEDAASAISAILGGGKGLSDVRLISDTEIGASLEVDYKGFEGKYKVKGVIFSKLKKPLADIICEEQTLAKPNGTLELKFQFRSGTGTYTNNSLETHFVSIVFSKSDGLLSGIDLGGQDIMGETYLYKMNKKWRVGGSESMVITVKLAPFRSAATIQP
jgi:hypothetical protein